MKYDNDITGRMNPVEKAQTIFMVTLSTTIVMTAVLVGWLVVEIIKAA